jgi:hypothetical protein
MSRRSLVSSEIIFLFFTDPCVGWSRSAGARMANGIHYHRGNRQILCRGSFTYCDISMSLGRFHDDRNIVAEGCQDHDEARLRVTINVATQDS